MDPSIMKLLEEDEVDESQYSGADVDAITAALNRDIGGDGFINQSSTFGGDSAEAVLHSSGSKSDQAIEQFQRPIDASCVQHEGNESQTTFPDPYQTKPEQQSESGILKQQTFSEGVEQPPFQQEDQSHDTCSATQFSEKDNAQISGQNIAYMEPDNKPLCQESQQHEIVKQPDNRIQPLQTAVHGVGPGNRSIAAPNVAFAYLLPLLRPQLDTEKNMQLEAVFSQLRKNEIGKEVFLRMVRNIVGDQKLRVAAQNLQKQQAKVQAAIDLQRTSYQHRQQLHTHSQESPTPLSGTRQLDTHYSSTSQVLATEVTVQANAHISVQEYGTQKSSTFQQTDAQNLHISQMNTQLVESSMSFETVMATHMQSHPHSLPTSFPLSGGGRTFCVNNTSTSGPSTASELVSVAAQSLDSKSRQIQQLQRTPSMPLGSTQLADSSNVAGYGQLFSADSNRSNSHSIVPKQGSMAWAPSMTNEQKHNFTSQSGLVKQESVDDLLTQQHKLTSFPDTQMPQHGLATGRENIVSGPMMEEKPSVRSGIYQNAVSSNQISNSVAVQAGTSMQVVHQVGMPSPTASGGNVKTTPKKPVIGQKKPLEDDSSLPVSSKKQKLSGAFLDQSIEQLNDVTAVSGVNLREEEEQLLAAPKEESRTSELTRRVVQEEEDKLFLQKGPLQKKIAEIMSKCGIKSASADVERCLSLGVEERMRGLISNMIRLSRQRVDLEKLKHKYLVTSDVRQQIVMMNRMAKEEWEKKQAESEKQQNPEHDAIAGTDIQKDKDEVRAKGTKAPREEDEKMRTAAANVAARVAVGGDDMLSKWQLMAEQARQKREGGHDGPSSSLPLSFKDVNQKVASCSRGDGPDVENIHPSLTSHTGGVRKFGRQLQGSPVARVARAVSLKDVIHTLEKEPQMSKSTLIYRLYEKIQSKEGPI